MSLVLPFWLNIIKELWSASSSKKTLTISNVFLLIVRIAMVTSIAVIVTQQCVLINTTWSAKLVEHERDIKEFTQLQCDHMKTTNVLFINECERLNIAMRVSPLVAAITTVINGWNSCLTMPCTQWVITISNHYEYKLLFILVSIGFAYYAHLFFTKTRDKTIELQDMIRAEVTRKYKRDCRV